MRDLDKILKAVADGLKSLAQGLDSVSAKLDTMASNRAPQAGKPKTAAAPAKARKAPKPAPREKAAAAAKPPRTRSAATATTEVLEMIAASADGIGTQALKSRTGFDEKKIHNIVYKLKKQGKITTRSKGVYVIKPK